MRIAVTGSSGHLGEALVRTLRSRGEEVVGIDLLESPYTTHVGSITDAGFVENAVRGCETVLHAATLHKPHIASHSAREFVQINVVGTLNLLEAAVSTGVSSVVFSSSTTTFGTALSPPVGAPAIWVTEELGCIPRNIYGVTKVAAEDLCELFARTRSLPCVVLRTSRFFPELDDRPEYRKGYEDTNLKANEYLHRRIDLADAVEAHLLAAHRATELEFGRYVVSATTPFTREHLAALRTDAPSVVRELHPEYVAEYERRGWRMLPQIDRVYVNESARRDLGWSPAYDFRHVLDCLGKNEDFRSSLARAVGSKGYHAEPSKTDPYPVRQDSTAPE